MDKTMDKTAVLDLPEALNRVDGGQELFLTLAELFFARKPERGCGYSRDAAATGLCRVSSCCP